MKIWELIAALGGFAVIVTGIVSYLGKKIVDSLFKKIDTYQSKKIELFKGEISRHNSLISQVASDHSKEFHQFNQKRIEALDLLWSELLRIKEISNEILYMDFFMTYDEIENSHLSTNHHTQEHLTRIGQVDLNKFVSDKKLLSYRPYISNSMWLNYELYLRVLARAILLLRKEKEYQGWWKEDSFMKQILEHHFNDNEIEYFKSKTFGGLSSICQLTEQKILDEISQMTSGVHASTNSLNHIKKLEALIKEFKVK